MRSSIMDDKHKPAVALPAREVSPPGAAPDSARRSFLKAAPLGMLLVVAGAAARAVPAVDPAAPDAARKRGYHETEHIRHYYRTAAYW
jgi:hypothetical protein